MIDDINRVLCCCEFYKAPRASLQSTVGVPPNGDVTSGDVLEPWQSPEAAQRATTTLLQFLRDSGFDTRL